MRKGLILTIIIIFACVLMCSTVYANDSESINSYEYTPIEHEEYVEDDSALDDIQPVPPMYMPLEDNNTTGEETQPMAEGRAITTTVESAWGDLLIQAYGDDYMTPYTKHDDGARVGEWTNSLIIENTDLVLEGKNDLDVVLKRRYDNQDTNQVYYEAVWGRTFFGTVFYEAVWGRTFFGTVF